MDKKAKMSGMIHGIIITSVLVLAAVIYVTTGSNVGAAPPSGYPGVNGVFCSFFGQAIATKERP